MNIILDPEKTLSGYVEVTLRNGVVLELGPQSELVGIRTRARDWDIVFTETGAIVMDGLNPDEELRKQHSSKPNAG